ncbi:glutathione S-transferase [Pasteurellaceae bacterium LIM206]|nr:glutathione S-transferase [Pasteurellaceae bacterium LIM206]
MIKLHHLERSRSMRILWLLEEIGVPYELITYQRDPQTMRAPEALKKTHPLGKSPILEIDGEIIVESGAMVELLINKFAPQLAPTTNSTEYGKYLQWLHFAESTAMFPLIYRMFGAKLTEQPNILGKFADSDISCVFGYIEREIGDKQFIVGNKLTGADFMLTFTIEFLQMLGALDQFPNIKRYYNGFNRLASWQRAMEIEQHCRTKGFSFT